MNKNTIHALTISLALALTACASMDYKSGTAVSAASYDSFTKGSTTQAEVINALGQPTNTTPMVADGSVTLSYVMDTISALPFAPNKSERVNFTFNKKGVLTEKSRVESDAPSKNPLTGK